MSEEIEKKYLVNNLSVDVSKHKFKKITQGYVAIEPGGNEVRIRAIGDEYFLTVKGVGSLTRQEHEFNIDMNTFAQLLKFCGNRIIRKRRYFVPIDNYTAELDIYTGKLSGLITVEIEFPNKKEAEAFRPPSWFGKDVTFDNSYKNRSLADK